MLGKGENADLWNRDNKIFIPKPFKPHYNSAKSYRPISLTSIIGKRFQHIINRRFFWWLESQLNIDTFQPAYRKNHSTTQALIFFIDSIKKGFNQKQSTVAVMIVLEESFDKCLEKRSLVQSMVCWGRGRMLLFINSFLHNCFSRCLVNTETSEWIETTIGAPQGSLLAVIIYLLTGYPVCTEKY